MSINAIFSAVEALKLISEAAITVAPMVQKMSEDATERKRIAAESARELAKIDATKDVFLTYLDKTFDERRDQFHRYFALLDNALVSRPESVGAILANINELAKKSPFRDLADVGKVRDALGDASTVFET